MGENTQFYQAYPFQIRNCGLYNIPSEAFKELGNLDYFKIENGKIDEVNINAWMSLNVERLTSDSHAIPRNLGKIEISYTRLSTTTLPTGLLYNMKNLTEAVLRVNIMSLFLIITQTFILVHRSRLKRSHEQIQHGHESKS